MASPLWDARPARSQHPKPTPQPTHCPPYVDSNNAYGVGHVPMSLTGFSQPNLPICEPTGPFYPSSNPLTLENPHGMAYSSQLLDPRTIVHNGPSHYASHACGTVGMPHPSQASGTIGQQPGMLQQKDVNTSVGQGPGCTLIANPDPSSVSAQQAKAVSEKRRASRGAFAAGDSYQRLKIKCDGKAVCTKCQADAIDCERSGLKTYNLILDPTVEIGTKQLAEDMRSGSLYGPQRPVQPSRDHLSCLPDGSADFSTEPLEGVRAQSTSTPSSHIPVASSSDANHEPLAAVYDEVECDANILWFYIEKYYEVTVYGSSIMPRELLSHMVKQFLIDRECWAERSGADIDVAILFLILSIGKLYTKKQSLPFSPACQAVVSGQGTKIPGFTYFQRGKEMFHTCSPTVVESIRAKSLIGCYLYQLGNISESIEYFFSASQFARDLVRSEIQRVRAVWPCCAVSTDAYHVLRLYTACASVENEAYCRMLGGVTSS